MNAFQIAVLLAVLAAIGFSMWRRRRAKRERDLRDAQELARQRLTEDIRRQDESAKLRARMRSSGDGWTPGIAKRPAPRPAASPIEETSWPAQHTIIAPAYGAADPGPVRPAYSGGGGGFDGGDWSSGGGSSSSSCDSSSSSSSSDGGSSSSCSSGD